MFEKLLGRFSGQFGPLRAPGRPYMDAPRPAMRLSATIVENPGSGKPSRGHFSFLKKNKIPNTKTYSEILKDLLIGCWGCQSAGPCPIGRAFGALHACTTPPHGERFILPQDDEV